MPEMHKNATEILVILFDAVIHGADMLLVEKAQDALFELSAALARDDLHERDAFVNRFLHDAIQFGFDLVAAIVDVVQIKFEFCHTLILLWR